MAILGDPGADEMASTTWEAPWGAWDVPQVRGCTTGSPEALVSALPLGGAVEQKAVLSACGSTRRTGLTAPGSGGNEGLIFPIF